MIPNTIRSNSPNQPYLRLDVLLVEEKMYQYRIMANDTCVQRARNHYRPLLESLLLSSLQQIVAKLLLSVGRTM